MANNLNTLETTIENQIDPNGAPGSILAQNHQNILKSVLDNVGKYTGLQFKAVKETNAGVVNTGEFVWNSNAMNETNGFTVTVARYTVDGQLIVRVLSRLKTGDLLKFKDRKGRSALFEFKKFTENVDVNSNIVYDLYIVGFSENINYTYQIGEILDCMIEIFPASVTTGLVNIQNSIQQMKLDFFWSLRDNLNETPETRWFTSTRIDGKVAKLGVVIQNYELLNSFTDATFTLLIDRYRKGGKKGQPNNILYPDKNVRKSKYRHENFNQTDGFFSVNRINEIEVTSSEMLLNFGQDFYFREKHTTFADDFFPRPKGKKSKNIHSTSIVKQGFVDLGFRMRIEIPSESYIWESHHIGFIRMLGIYNIKDPMNEQRLITYSYK